MKKIAVLICSLLFIANIQVLGQDTIDIPVPNVFQKGNRICWAACIEMFLLSRGDASQNQCMIAEKMLRGIKSDPSITCTPCSMSCCKNCIKPLKPCNLMVSDIQIMGFLKDSFSINTTSSVANWQILNQEVKFSSRPMFGLSKTDIDRTVCATNHVVIIRGYEIDQRTVSNSKDTFYRVNNPFGRCGSGYSKLRFSQLETINEVCSYIYEVHPSVQPLSISVTPPKILEKTDEDWTGELTEPQSQKDLARKLDNGSYLKLETLYFSTENYKSETAIELLYQKGKPPYTVTTLQQMGDYWLPIEIKHTNIHQNFIANAEQLSLFSNYKQYCRTDLPIIPYSKIVFLPYYDEYYVFRSVKNNEILFLPLDGNNDDEKNDTLSLGVINKTYGINDDILKKRLLQFLSKKSFYNKLN
jgi:hypothetical protein